MSDTPARHLGNQGRGGVKMTKSSNQKEIWEQIREAWSYINQKESVDKYDAVAVETIKDRIRVAAQSRGLELSN